LKKKKCQQNGFTIEELSNILKHSTPKTINIIKNTVDASICIPTKKP